MPTRHLPLLSGKVCFEGFVVRIEQMFSCRIFFSLGGYVVFHCAVATCVFLSLLYQKKAL